MQQDKEQLPLDAKLLSLAIIELNISRRNVAVYPINHPSIKQSIDRAYKHLQSLFELRNEITLAIAKDTLVIDEYFLDKRNPVYAEFALTLHKIGIVSITFIAGISEDEIIRFHQTLVADPEVIKGKGGVIPAMQEMGITHIRPALVDYGAFHFVEGKKEHAEQEFNIWENYVYGLLENKLLSAEDAERIRGIPPEVFAQIINKTVSEAADEATYDKVITTYLKTSSEDKRLKKGSLGNLAAFIEGLKPSLKKQFLSGAFRNIAPDPVLAQRISQELSTDQLMAMLTDINERDEVIPETLRNLLEKFSKIKQESITIDSRLLSSGDSVIDDIQMTPEVLKLFEKDRFQDSVTDTYKQELQKILSAEVSGGQARIAGELIAESNDESIERYLTDVLIELLGHEALLTEEESLKVAERFIENITIFLQTGQFDELVSIYDAMGGKAIQDRYQNIANTILAHMAAEEFIQTLLSYYRFWGRKNRRDVIEFSKRLKSRLIKPIITALMDEEDAALRSFYLSVLSEFGQDVVPQALEHLSDAQWFVRRNMLILLRECGNRTVLKNVKPFCEDRDLRIAIEAMKAYLHFNDNDVLRYLKQHLLSSDIEIRDQIIKLIGAYRVKLLVPDLIKLLLKKDIMGGDFHLKIPIIKALGDIGDERALRYLLDICKTKSLLYKGSLDLLKIEIYKTLRNYPAPAIQPLLQEGLNSKNEEIITLCRRLTERKEKDGGE